MNRLALHICLSAADGVACVSESTLDRLVALRPDVAARSLRLPNVVESGPGPQPLDIPALAGRRFILAVAQHRHNKCLPLTLRAFARLLEITRDADTFLLIVGESGPETPRLKHLLHDLGLESRVVFTSGISEQNLQWCYQQTDLLLATSSIEGFGLPVAEALLAGCPVVCSDIAAFRELNPGTLTLVNTDEFPVESFAYAMRAVRARPSCCPQLLPHLSAKAVGDACLELYQEMLLPQSCSTARRLGFLTERRQEGSCL